MRSMSSSSEKNSIVNYQSEIELLKKALAEKSEEASLIYERQAELEESLLVCEDKYKRIATSHRKILSINQNLEEKLLKLVDRNSGEKAQLIGDCATLNLRLSQANISILQKQREIERYKQDIALALHLLQCNPNSSFITPSIKSLPIEIQSKLSSYMRREMNTSDDNSKGYQRIPTCDPSISFSPLASSHGSHKNDLSPITVSKFLEDELKMSMKHCDTCCCTFKDLTISSDVQRTYSVGIQTDLTTINCMRCNSNLNSPSHQNNNASYMKKLRSSDSVFSECNLSDYTNERNATPPKKDDLTINPILSHSHLTHHRMCERTKNMNARRNTFSESAKNEQQQLPSINSSTPQLHRASSKDLKNEEIKSSSNKARNYPQQKSPSNVGSSSNDLNGTKIFENYNKDLLKWIKNKNLKVVGPRMCALRIQDDNVVYVDSASDEVRSIPYSRRRTLVDDDLIENDENGDLPINLHSSRSSMCNVDDDIFSTNKTDSEKFNEFKKELHQSNCNNNNNNNSQPEEIIGEGDTTSITDSVNENAIMKHQRVAEWIQNSSKINSLEDSAQKLSAPVYESNKNVILEKLIDIDDDDDEPKVKENVLSKEENGNDREKIDLLQMEYNVKQFLLKQKSVYADLHFSNDDVATANDDIAAEKIPDASHYGVKRTETNL